jgi:hypothetical protein
MFLFDSIKELEMASYICEESLVKELNHTSHSDAELNLADFLYRKGFYMKHHSEWCNKYMYQYYSINCNENGFCFTFNLVNAHRIFRTETVDPAFLRQYELKSFNTMPQLWSMEDGYTKNSMKNYPLRSLERGMENGLKTSVITDKLSLKEISDLCRKSPQSIKITLHHPAEVLHENSFIEVPFNKSVSVVVKPKITRTSESLKSYDPKV